MKSFLASFLGCALAAFAVSAAPAIDRNGNQLSDLWEVAYDAATLPPGADTDGDGYNNAAECAAGTNPRDPLSRPRLAVDAPLAGFARLNWATAPGKVYALQSKLALVPGAWLVETNFLAAGTNFSAEQNAAGAKFFRFGISDADSDGDGLNDWEERAFGYNPLAVYTERFAQTDRERASNSLAAVSVVSVSAMDPLLFERWPDAGLIVLRRTGGLAPLTVNFSLGGTAARGVDYTGPAGNTAAFGPGQREVWLAFSPITDADDAEGDETITLTLQAGTNYTRGSNTVATLTLANETATSPPNAKAAIRFLMQAAWGPDQDSAGDADYIPENAEEVMTLGYAGWINDQFTRPVGWLQPFVEWCIPRANSDELYGDWKEWSWWSRVLGVPKLRPDAATNTVPDPLRQRMAFVLSQIFVVSDRPEEFANEPLALVNYYDVLLRHAFGNFSNLLWDVTLHPAMGIYLSHMGNKKPDPVNRIYPDENYAREIMQLFTIGLWELNPDGTRRLGTNGQPIATYDNRNVTEFARVFTGMAFGGSNQNFGLWPRDFTKPMGAWDEFHDVNPKTLLGGVTTPARAASSGTNGLATRADVRAAVSNLFHHPNVGPFIGRQLIQKFVGSNPSTGYVARVAAAFNDNGAGVRGDLRAMLAAVLLDPEARAAANTQAPAFGRLKDSFTRVVNFARAFNASSSAGWISLDLFYDRFLQEPLKSPSVFNFFLPSYSPPGALTQAGLVAPEFQIVNASSGVAGPNHLWNSVWGGLRYDGINPASRATTLNLTQELLLTIPPAFVNDPYANVEPLDPDALLRRLDLVLTGGTLTPENFQVIREHVARVRFPTWEWQKERIRLAIYLVTTTPEHAVLR